jgi:5-hydroxyisourate hydrolase-like protein (transthyretin family)
MPIETTRTKLTLRNALTLIAKIIVVIAGTFWALVQIISTVAYDWSVSAFAALTGVPQQQFVPEDFTAPTWADKIFTDNYYYAFIVIALLVGIAGMLILTKRRSIFTAIGVLAAFVLPSERENWGIIKDKETGKPIAFAIVRVVKKGSESEDYVVQETVADLDGRYRLNLSNVSEEYKLSVSATDYITSISQIEYVPAGNENFNVIQDVQLSRTNESKVENRFSHIRPYLYNGLIWTIYIVCIIMLIFSIIYTVGYPGSWYGIVSIILYGAASIWNTRIMIQRFSAKSGRVLDISTNKPLTGAFVNLYGTDSENLLDSSISGKDGYARFSVEPGEYKLKVSKSGYEQKEVVTNVKLNATGYLTKNIFLKPISNSTTNKANTSEQSSLSSPFTS